MVTIKDVAKRAGVSVATVSRVLNDSGYYDDDTAKAVRQAVADIGYRQNIHWSRLKRKASNTVCFLLGNRSSMNSMQMRLLMASEQALHSAGYDLVFSGFRYSQDERPSRLQLPRMIAQDGIVDGLILAGVHHANFLDALDARGLPWVILGNTFIGNSSRVKSNAITYDDVGGAYEATSYLARLGHRRIAFIGNVELPWFARRFAGYRHALETAGLNELAVGHDWEVGNIEYGQLAVAELLRGSTPPTAIFAANDEIAAGAWKELTRRRVSIPKDMSLLGFGDREEFSIIEPSLTTVSVLHDQLGHALADMILERLRGAERAPAVEFPCKVVERASCGPPAARLNVARG
jgi:DNA-binding LacI/PurR family transcriptional regulator